jgi:hypothetical protein
LQQASQVFVISQPMQELYDGLFGTQSEVLFGPADPSTTLPQNASPESDQVRLAYFGSIFRWQSDALEMLVRHLPILNATLDVFGFHTLPPCLHSARVCVHQPVTADAVLTRMQQYHGVVVPAGFSEDLRHLSDLNISTKLSECYASGTVPIIVGPRRAAMCRFAEEHGGALVLDDSANPAQLKAVRDLRLAEIRKPLLRKAREVAIKHCGSVIMRQKWTRSWRTLEAGLQPNHSTPRISAGEAEASV